MMYTSSPVDFHLIADPGGQRRIEELFSLVPNPLHDVRLYFYPVETPDMLARFDRAINAKPDMPKYGAIRSTHQAGNGSSAHPFRRYFCLTYRIAGLLKVRYRETRGM